MFIKNITKVGIKADGHNQGKKHILWHQVFLWTVYNLSEWVTIKISTQVSKNFGNLYDINHYIMNQPYW